MGLGSTTEVKLLDGAVAGGGVGADAAGTAEEAGAALSGGEPSLLRGLGPRCSESQWLSC